MIIGVGNDTLEVARMERELQSGGPRFREQLFTPGEISYCEGKADPAQHFAAHFAAKEAFLKALGIGLAAGMSWRNIEINHPSSGQTQIVLSDQAQRLAREHGVTDLFLSLTHNAEVAVASVILQGPGPASPRQVAA